MKLPSISAALFILALTAQGIASDLDYQVLDDPNGHQVELVYHKDGAQYYLHSSTTSPLAKETHQTRGLFNFRPDGTAIGYIPISTETAARYTLNLDIDRIGALEMTMYDAKSRFEFVQLNNSRYHMIWNGSALVTPNPSPPFKFYTQSVFPGATPAEFTLSPYVLNITESYGGDRNRIIPTARLVHDLDNFENKEDGYTQILSLMTSSGHLPGMEIFGLGYFIFRESGAGSSFLQLPQIVQTICSGSPIRLFYRDPNNNDIPMKRYWASTAHTDIEPYTFTGSVYHDRISLALTYGADVQLYIPNFAYQFVQIVSATKKNDIQLYLRDDMTTFRMYAYRPTGGKHYPLDAAPDASNDVYFEGYYEDRLNTRFIATPYQ